MSEYQFSENYHDLSTDNGFQFEFNCENCREAWRSMFKTYGASTVEGVLGAAEGIFGGFLGRAHDIASRVRSAGWSTARDHAFQEAVAQAQGHFHRCPRCTKHFCIQCWNSDDGTCVVCVPRLEPEVAAAKREAKIQKAREEAQAQATISQDEMADRVISCPKCSAAVGHAKFCPECGTPVSLTRKCPSCAKEIPSSSKFCPECGGKC